MPLKKIAPKKVVPKKVAPKKVDPKKVVPKKVAPKKITIRRKKIAGNTYIFNQNLAKKVNNYLKKHIKLIIHNLYAEIIEK